MIESLIAGERNPAVLAEWIRLGCGRRSPRSTEALVGRFAAHHGAVARVILDHIDILDTTIARLHDEVASRLGPFEAAVALLETTPRVARKTAKTIVAETGAEMARFPTAAQLCAWPGVAPANHESAGKRRPAGTRQGANWLRRSLIEAAKAASGTKDTYLGAQYRQIAARGRTRLRSPSLTRSCSRPGTGSPPARPTTSLLDYLSRRDTQAETRRLLKRLESLGHSVTINPAA